MVVPPPAVTLTFDLLNPKFNQHIYEPNYTSVTQIRRNSLPLVSEIRCSQGFRDAQTHSLTDGQTRIQCASGTFFNIKMMRVYVRMFTANQFNLPDGRHTGSRMRLTGSLFWPYLVWSRPWPLTFWPQNLTGPYLSPNMHQICKAGEIPTIGLKDIIMYANFQDAHTDQQIRKHNTSSTSNCNGGRSTKRQHSVEKEC